jgi:serine/threonine protein kinase
MPIPETVAGQATAWKLIKKLGEGDAGEVYRVESLLENRVAILKRPHRGGFPSEIIRQASQIETEGKLLRSLHSAALEQRAGRVTVPELLDHSKAGTEFSERYFIVIEEAPGFDLNALARAIHIRTTEAGGETESQIEPEHVHISALASTGQAPALLLLRTLVLTLAFIEQIHTLKLNNDGLIQDGAIWNDIKPDHLFWDAEQSRLTLIDWGNGKFLESDGATKDRRYSRTDDAKQFVQALGKYLATYNPDLHRLLEWPEQLDGIEAYVQALPEIKGRVEAHLVQQLDDLAGLRKRERELIENASGTPDQLESLSQVQVAILSYGDLPDAAGLENCATNLATTLASQGKFPEFHQVCERALSFPHGRAEKWQLLGQIAEVAMQHGESASGHYQQALVAGLVDDWPSAVWVLLQANRAETLPSWWSDLTERIRHLNSEIDHDLLAPYTALTRIALILQANAEKLEKNSLADNPSDLPEDEQIALYQSILRELRTEILPKWLEFEPEPPDAGLDYREVERLLDDVGRLVPNARQAIIRTINQPAAQVQIVLQAWDRREFETARKGLRRVLVWDPHRRRVLAAERAIQGIPSWLERVRFGPHNGQALNDFLVEMEVAGRELKSRVGPARWLDQILSTMQRLRKGERPADLVDAAPEIVQELPWINRVGWTPPVPVAPITAIPLARTSVPASNGPTMTSALETRLGQEQGFMLAEPLDTWAPEARGSSARVFLGFLRTPDDRLKQAAVKVMRRDSIDYALPLFREEILILQQMKDVPGMTGALEMGFIKLDRGYDLPSEQTQGSARGLHGEVQRIGPDQTEEFLAELADKAARGWLPYLALEKRTAEENLMMLCDAGYTGGRFLSVAEGLRAIIQICEILQEAHTRQIVYRDHKILHYYWLEAYNGVFLIDWNVAKIHPDGLTAEEKQFDLVQFGARAMHHILTGRPAPGALPMGPTRPEEIEAAAHSYRVQWTYDDQRLPYQLKELLEQVLAGNYSDAATLKSDLVYAFEQLLGIPG